MKKIDRSVPRLQWLSYLSEAGSEIVAIADYEQELILRRVKLLVELTELDGRLGALVRRAEGALKQWTTEEIASAKAASSRAVKL